jgi:hypothetical protein
LSSAETKPRLSDEELAHALTLVRQSDSVELKLTIPTGEQRATLAALDLDPLDAQIRQVFFLDTPDLILNESGLVVRARRRQGKADDSVVKLRPVIPDELPKELRTSPRLTVEVDAMPGGYVCSATLKARHDEPCVRQAIHGERPLRKLFTKEQRAFYAEHAPPDIAIDELTVLGPIFVLKLRFTPKQLAKEMVAELWLYPDGSRILELSRKCLPDEAFEAAVETREFLSDAGVDLGGLQETKTRTALEFFAADHLAQDHV